LKKEIKNHDFKFTIWKQCGLPEPTLSPSRGHTYLLSSVKKSAIKSIASTTDGVKLKTPSIVGARPFEKLTAGLKSKNPCVCVVLEKDSRVFC
jgi:hypothetical protein